MTSQARIMTLQPNRYCFVTKRRAHSEMRLHFMERIAIKMFEAILLKALIKYTPLE
jgi:hypothetical protein